MRIPGARETRALLARHGLRPNAAAGQHFVIDPNTVRKVVRLGGVSPGDRVLEVGPGLGALTLALVEAGASVTAIELDRSLRGALEEVLADHPVHLVWGDALTVGRRSLLAGRPSAMVSNLPYNVATPLVLRLLTEFPSLAAHAFMVQREVGERLVAAPGSAAYGAVSAKVAYLAAGSIAGRVSRRAFFPVPGVDSVVVRLVRRGRPPVAGARDRIFAVIDAGFAQRRKTLRNALRGASLDAAVVERALERAGVDGGARAEELGLEALAAVARALPRDAPLQARGRSR